MGDKILICRRVSYGPAAVPSIPRQCYQCGEPVWVAGSSPEHDKVLCTDCAVGDSEAKPEPPTEKQLSALDAFNAVKAEDLESIKGLSIVIERLCDSLRNLRREDPDKFFGQPVERLYDSLEAALGSFYRAAVSEEREADKIDPGAS